MNPPLAPFPDLTTMKKVKRMMSGVSAGEQVVTEGAVRLMDGQRMEVRP